MFCEAGIGSSDALASSARQSLTNTTVSVKRKLGKRKIGELRRVGNPWYTSDGGICRRGENWEGEWFVDTIPNSKGGAKWDPELILRSLAESGFRSRQRLGRTDRLSLNRLGMEKILRDGRDFLEQRIAPAAPKNDGRQTPMRGHPIFVAQHATATCCRGCIARWYNIPTGRTLTDQEIDAILDMLRRWLERQPDTDEGFVDPAGSGKTGETDGTNGTDGTSSSKGPKQRWLFPK